MSESYSGSVDEKIIGETEVHVRCTTPDHEPEMCGGWSETVELDRAAEWNDGGETFNLPGYSPECPDCGNPHEFEVEGVGVFFP